MCSARLSKGSRVVRPRSDFTAILPWDKLPARLLLLPSSSSSHSGDKQAVREAVGTLEVGQPVSVHAHIVNTAAVPLWGLSSRERYGRLLKQVGVETFVEDLTSLESGDQVLLVRGDYLLDPRLIRRLATSSNLVLEAPTDSSPTVVAAQVPARLAPQAAAVMSGDEPARSLASPDLRVETPETLASSFDEFLLKSEPPVVAPIRPDTQRLLERRLFAGSYKGVTDLVTKWLWPIPAEWATRLCVVLGLKPNHVTMLSLLLVIVAGALFAYGLHGWGLLAGWMMTFLDTVDGKLARVTVTSSRFGNALDKTMDLLHPPVWYVLWGVGLPTFETGASGLTLSVTLWTIVLGYLVGRLAEGAFLLWLGRFGIFCWRPFDSYMRLITARRNPNLILLTLGLLAGRPDMGLVAIAGWTTLSSLLLLVRLGLAVHQRVTSGPLRSWLADVSQKRKDGSLASRLFIQQPSER